MIDNHKWIGGFIHRLLPLADPNGPDRAALAHLRRGLGEPAAATLTRVGWLFNGVPDDGLDAAILAAGLFAWVKGRSAQQDGVNFGKAFGAGLNEDEKKRREKRFTTLIDADETELPFQLRQAVTLMEGQSLDWSLLVRHLMNWNHGDRWVQKEWARGFWWTQTPKDDTENEDANEPAKAATH